MCVFKAALPRDTRLAGGEGRDGQVWGSASASDQTKQAAEGVGRAAFVRVYLSAAISRTLQIEWRLLDTRLIPLKTSNGQKLHQQPPSTLRGYCINLPCRHPTHALEHTYTYTRVYVYIHVRYECIETDVCSLLYLRATFSRYQLVYHPSRLPPRLSPLPLSSWKRRDAARARVHRDERTRSRFFPPSPCPTRPLLSPCTASRVSRRPKENPFDDSTTATPTWKISVIFRVTAARVDSARSEGVNWRTRRRGGGEEDEWFPRKICFDPFCLFDSI